MHVIYLYQCVLKGCQPEILSDEKLLLRLLYELPEHIKMHRISVPMITAVSSEKTDYVGYSGFVLISESHIAFHTWPEHFLCELTIVSCKSFSAQQATNFACQLLQTTFADPLFLTQEVNTLPVPAGESVPEQAEGPYVR
jgi:S-adenosylmethionine decarboxylase